LQWNRSPEKFHFAIVADLTRGSRLPVFASAVEQLNLLQPEFVLSVGDLIEGNADDPAQLAAEWRAVQTIIGRLQMPFFYLPGNHDYSTPKIQKLWRAKFGASYYHFVHHGVLFLMLNSEDRRQNDEGRLGDEQIVWVRTTLRENAAVRWTIILVHRPFWSKANVAETGWLEVEQALADRPYTVFAGHEHFYRKTERRGRLYYQLATTGGESRLRGPAYGEVDHITWVTLKANGPVVANLLVEGIYGDDLRKPLESVAGK
jgi:hypothetical protein